jgi:hypothetical protein
MTARPTPFDHRPDPALGAALREAPAPANHAAFVARVSAALDTAAPPSPWTVLAPPRRPTVRQLLVRLRAPMPDLVVLPPDGRY